MPIDYDDLTFIELEPVRRFLERSPMLSQREWQHVLNDQETHTILVHPTDSGVVFAGTMDGVWRSADRGATFQRTRPDRASTQ